MQKRNDFLKARTGYRKKKGIIDRQVQVFKLSDKFNNESYLIDNKCKCANEICLAVFIYAGL